MKPKPLSKSSWKPSALPWWQLRRGAAGDIGRGMFGSPDLRLWMLAASRVGGYGHACFDPGELATLLPKVVHRTGEVETYSERNLRRFIARLVDAGALSPASNTRCLVIPIEILDAPLAAPRVSCPEHRCRHVWSTRLQGWAQVKADRSLDLEELAARLDELNESELVSVGDRI
ncbi:hypothetical protein QWY28_21610 [Nocardioides sp. SOB77]|uniref:Uncharacterized protein n=1 Tax=Nocardioides oceani TaxID=3058369 RepID=A0ABT8FM79_9ACTN|nr:hypothetical protein [Nocardioides oceani]MDN4175575.1 hypothetical protein [Nocardioides oceani]